MSFNSNSNKITVFYDGLCRVCSREITHYKKQSGAENFAFIDITHSEFAPQAHGLDPSAVHRVMHVKDRDGQLHTGAEAFRVIWSALPRYSFLYRWTDNALARFCMRVGYAGFARIRPYLPRKKAECKDSPYCV